MESFLADLNDLIASAGDVSGVELIGALEFVKQQLILELLTDEGSDQQDAA